MYKVTVPVMLNESDEINEKILKELMRCKADRVLLIVSKKCGEAFSTEENINKLSRVIKYFKDNNIETGVWMGETVGHLAKKINGFKGLYTNQVYLNAGEGMPYCLLDKDFEKDICEYVEGIAKCSPDLILFDDDLRFGNWEMGPGCFCKLHMDAVSKELGENINVEELQKKITEGGKNKYRTAWLKVKGKSKTDFLENVRKTVDNIDPKIRMGFCCSAYAWDSDGAEVIDCAKAIAGDNKPFIRCAGGLYASNKNIGYMIDVQRTQMSWTKESDMERVSEGDPYPRPRYAIPSSHLECYDMILRADGNSDGIMKYMIDYHSSPDYETGYVDNMADNFLLYEKIDKCFAKKNSVGVRPYNVMHRIENMEFNSDTEEACKNILNGNMNYSSLSFTTLNSLPTTFERGYVNVIFGENARYIPEIDLCNGSIIDMTAAKILTERGIDVGIEEICEMSNECITDISLLDILSEYFIEENEVVRLSRPGNSCSSTSEGLYDIGVKNIKHRPKVRVLTEISDGKNTVDGCYEYENSEGHKFLVYPFDASRVGDLTGWFDSYSRRRQVIKSIEWMNKDSLLAYADGNQIMLYTMVKKDDNGVSVGLWNLYDDKVKNLNIILNAEFEEVEFINCSGKAEKNKVILDSVIYPYEFAGLNIKLKK